MNRNVPDKMPYLRLYPASRREVFHNFFQADAGRMTGFSLPSITFQIQPKLHFSMSTQRDLPEQPKFMSGAVQRSL